MPCTCLERTEHTPLRSTLLSQRYICRRSWKHSLLMKMNWQGTRHMSILPLPRFRWNIFLRHRGYMALNPRLL